MHFISNIFSEFQRFSKIGKVDSGKISQTDNFIIKGDNLSVLKELVPTHSGKIKLICIDPPYNTGRNKFIYSDNLDSSAWLKFMEKRLILARELLSINGIIYIHCDDQENAYLKILCDKIFGREHFITNLIWRKKAGGANDSNDIAIEHEYILAYSKSENGIYKIPLDAKITASYKFEDDKIKTQGKYKVKDLNDLSLIDSFGLHYDITCPDGTILKAKNHQWKCNKKTFENRLNDNRIIFKKIGDRWKVYYKIYLNEQRGKLVYDEKGKLIPRGRNLSSILYNVALNKDGNSDMSKLFNGEKPFKYPKPVNLLKILIQSASKHGDIILDFFAGSGTTGQAVLELNQSKESRQFILVENMDFIKEITVPRIIKSLELYDSKETFVYCELQN